MKYTIDQIKAAYWEEFHESGELWFPYFEESPESNSRATESSWEEFEEALNDACKKKK